MDSTANNFNPLATVDDGSCTFDSDVYGCMDSTATNFNPLATVDDGSCTFDSDVYGCMDSTATNFNPSATIDNGNCVYTEYIYGCIDSTASNYNSSANIDDGSCEYDTDVWGCTDVNATNYNSSANHDDGHCEYNLIVLGCTDSQALNYNPVANQNDGSCEYDSSIIAGCTDPYALNYNEFASQDNGSCIYIVVTDDIEGCLDTLADNYNPVATINNESCLYGETDIPGCTSPMALNYNPNATIEDESCVFAYPVDIIEGDLPPEVTVIVDTLGSLAHEDCGFDFSTAIDSISVSSITLLSNNQFEVDWNIWQNGINTIITNVYTSDANGGVVLYLSIICNSGTTKSGDIQAITVSSAINLTTTEIDSYNFSNMNAKVFPVPTNSIITLSFESIDAEIYQTNIYSIDGRKVFSEIIQSNIGINSFELDCSQLKKGIYFLNLNKNGQILYSTKIIKN